MSGAVVCERPGSPGDSLLIARPSTLRAAPYTWDDNGDLTDRGSDSFSWGRDSHEDRMVEATVNSVTTNFVYRGDGLRDSRAVSGGATTQFTWDPSGEGLGGLPVVLDDGNQYLYGAGLTAMKQSGNWYYYLADGLGSTMAIVDASGNSQKSYTYDVYGEATPSGGLANEFDFAGQQTDGTGLQYLRARYYDPGTGTFLSRDPLTAHPFWIQSGFQYAAGSPATYSDETGAYPTDERGCRTDERADPYCVGDDPPSGMHLANQPAAGCEPGGPLYPHCDQFQPPYPCDQQQPTVGGTCANIIEQPKSLIGEYWHEILAGCQEDQALCATALGGSLALFLIRRMGNTLITSAGCAAAGPEAAAACAALRIALMARSIMLGGLNTALIRELRERGRQRMERQESTQ